MSSASLQSSYNSTLVDPPAALPSMLLRFIEQADMERQARLAAEFERLKQALSAGASSGPAPERARASGTGAGVDELLSNLRIASSDLR